MAEHRLGAGSSCALRFGEAEVRLRLGLEMKEIQPQQASASQTSGGKGSRLQPVRTRGAQPVLGFPRSLGQRRGLWEPSCPSSTADACGRAGSHHSRAPRSPCVWPEAPSVVSLPQSYF